MWGPHATSTSLSLCSRRSRLSARALIDARPIDCADPMGARGRGLRTSVHGDWRRGGAVTHVYVTIPLPPPSARPAPPSKHHAHGALEQAAAISMCYVHKIAGGPVT